MKTQKQRKAWKDRLDERCKAIVKARARGECEYCEDAEGVDPHHVQGKSTNALQFHIPGIIFVCRSCHSYLHKNPIINKMWFTSKYGIDAWSKLVWLRNVHKTSLAEAGEGIREYEADNT